MNKRTFIKTTALAGAAGLVGSSLQAAEKALQTVSASGFSLPFLPYAYDALEPHFDKMTMEIHYSKHHQAYVNNLNKALDGTAALELPIEEICKNISKYPMVVRNNGGGHYNHTFFWSILKQTNNDLPVGKLKAAIESKFSTLQAFKDEFSKAALSRFGSGWAWLIVNEKKELQIVSTPNQDNPLMDIAEVKGTPVLALDVWEHAYYLKYQNKRADFVAAYWNVLDWKVAEENFTKAIK